MNFGAFHSLFYPKGMDCSRQCGRTVKSTTPHDNLVTHEVPRSANEYVFATIAPNYQNSLSTLARLSFRHRQMGRAGGRLGLMLTGHHVVLLQLLGAASTLVTAFVVAMSAPLVLWQPSIGIGIGIGPRSTRVSSSWIYWSRLWARYR